MPDTKFRGSLLGADSARPAGERDSAAGFSSETDRKINAIINVFTSCWYQEDEVDLSTLPDPDMNDGDMPLPIPMPPYEQEDE